MESLAVLDQRRVSHLGCCSWLGFIHRRYSMQTIRIYKQIRGLKDSNFSKLIQELKSNLESIKL